MCTHNLLWFSALIALSIATMQGCGGQVTSSPTATAGASGSNVAGQSGSAEGGTAHAAGGGSSAGSAASIDSGGDGGDLTVAGNGGDSGEGGTAGNDGHGGGVGGNPAQSGGAAGNSESYGGTAGHGATAGAGVTTTGGQNGNAGSAGAPASCSPVGHYCRANDIYSCDSSGTELLYYPCALAGGYCVDGDWRCLARVCEPNGPTCTGSIATSCNADGSGTLSGGTDCALNDQTCNEQGVCAPKVCEPNQRFCSGDTVYSCNQWGTHSYAEQECGPGKYCFSRGSRADCSKNTCTPGATGCVGENFGQCGADGNSVTNATDCSAASQVCTADGCSGSSVDTIDAATDSASTDGTMVIGNAFDVLSARTVTGIEVYMNLFFARDLSWRIYELNSLTAASNPNPKWILKFQHTTSELAGERFHSSGPLNFQILAGHSYAFGVQVLGTWNYYRYGQNLPQTLPFARTVSIMYANPDSDVVDASIGDRLLYQRITTIAP